jgi:uncharacterized spore protein YtfJ
MKIEDLAGTARDAITVKKVFGEPYEHDGLTVITAAQVAGGAGGGAGHDGHGQEGEGGGFRMAAKPRGAFVVREGQVTWRPAVDVNRLVGTLAAVAITYLVTRMRVERERSRASRHA